MAQKAFKADDNEVIGDSGSKTNGIIVNLAKNKKFRNLIYILNLRAIGEPNFLIFNSKKGFNYLQLAFIKATIFRHFNLKSYIQIQTIA